MRRECRWAVSQPQARVVPWLIPRTFGQGARLLSESHSRNWTLDPRLSCAVNARLRRGGEITPTKKAKGNADAALSLYCCNNCNSFDIRGYRRAAADDTVAD